MIGTLLSIYIIRLRGLVELRIKIKKIGESVTARVHPAATISLCREAHNTTRYMGSTCSFSNTTTSHSSELDMCESKLG